MEKYNGLSDKAIIYSLENCIESQALIIGQQGIKNKELSERLEILEERIEHNLKWMDWMMYSSDEETRLKLQEQANKYEITIKGILSEKSSKPEDPNKSPLL